MSRETPLVFVVAGEESGDLLGGRLMAALNAKTQGRIAYAGVGGTRMAAQGLTSLFSMTDLSVMGITEVLPRLKLILSRIRETVAEIERLKPDVLVTIDAPDFSFRVAKRIAASAPDVKRIHYVAPSVWVWRPGRAATIAKFLDHLLALLPFEPPYFERVGLPCSFVGHPAIEGGAGRGDGAAFRARHNIPADRRIVVMLPGSRRGEVDRLQPIFIDALKRLQQGRAPFTIVVPTVPNVEAQVRTGLREAGFDAVLIQGEAEKFDAFAAAEIALAKSGTVTLELALAGVPTVLSYRVAWLSYKIATARTTLKLVGLPNIVLNRMLMPELLQDQCRADLLAAALAKLLDDPAARAAQIDGMAEVRALLSPSGTTPSEAAADVVLKVMGASDSH